MVVRRRMLSRVKRGRLGAGVTVKVDMLARREWRKHTRERVVERKRTRGEGERRRHV